MSSFDSYELAIPINDNIYIRQLDDFRMSVESDSGSGSDGEYKKITYPEAVQRLEKYLISNELDVLHDYICCKKQVFDHASSQELFKYNALNIHSFIATVVIVFLPWFQPNTGVAISVLSGFILFLQHWIYYSKCGILAHSYANKSQAYSTLLVYLSNGKFASNATVLKNMETRLECLDQNVPVNYVKKLPILSSMNIFAAFKHVDNNRNIQIRKYIHAENKLSKAKAKDQQSQDYENKIIKIKENLSKLNYDKLKNQIIKEIQSI